MKRARIYRPTRTAMQSGKANTHHWCLEFIPDDARFIDPIMGWTGSNDMYANEVTLTFDNKEQAISYAKRHNIDFELLEPKEHKLKLQAYTKNFLSN